MMKKILIVLFILIVLVFSETKFSKILQDEMENNEIFDINVHMKDKVNLDLLPLSDLDHITRGRFIVQELQELATKTQEPLLKVLDALRIKYQTFWINNVIVIHGATKQLITYLSKREDVGRISSDAKFKAIDDLESSGREESAPSSGDEDVEWNIKLVKADAVWEKGFTGTGRVVSSADTGVDFTHEAIKDNYRGYDKSTGKLDHNYNWWDAIKERIVGNKCGINVQYPCDDNGHGTHTVGTMLGKSSTRQFGVAPGAKWIACKNMDNGYGRPSTYNGCLQFLLAPCDLQGKNANPDLRPDSIGNSYGCPRSEKCEPEDLRDAVEALRKAGVFVAVAAGNSGSSCSSINDPPGHYAASISIGAIDSRGSIAYFSSRGPIKLDGSNRRKPDICAPGVGVYSCVPGNRYASFSGTSMATPHVAGAVALLWHAKPNLQRDIDATQKVLEKAAEPKDSSQCDKGGIPNNVYGYGNMNILKAVEL